MDRSQQAAGKVRRLAAQGKVAAVVEYKAPQVRAKESAARTARSAAVALALACFPILISFLTVRDFGRDALVGLGTGLGIAVLMVGLNWAQKVKEAQGDDAPLDSGEQP